MKFLPYISLALILCLPFFSSSQEFKVIKLGPQVNTPVYDEIAPVVSSNGKTLYFTREGYPVFNKTLNEDGKIVNDSNEDHYFNLLASAYGLPANSKKEEVIKSSFNQDIWIASQEESTFDKVSHPDSPLNNAYPNSVCAIINNEEFIVVNQFPEKSGVKKGFSKTFKKKNGDWVDPIPLHIEGYESLSPDVSLAASHDGEILILSLETKNGYGDNDLYISFRKGPNHYSYPRHLGPAVNSIARETSPSISKDKKTLFFASNRSGGSGGMDLYFVKRLDKDWKIITAPQRFITPINTPADESQPYFVKSTGELFFISKRGGSSDIYKVQIAPPIPEEVTVSGYIVDPETNRLVSGNIVTAPSRTNVFNEVFESTDGYFKIQVPKGEPYHIAATKSGYLGNVKTIAFKEENVYFKEQRMQIKMSRIDGNKNILQNTIYFEQSTPNILSESHPYLEELGLKLRANDHVQILIEGHTDNVGEEKTLHKLSEERAVAIKAYLVNRTGIDTERIKTIGYGSTLPVNDNSTESLRSKNRRVEVKVFQNQNPSEETFEETISSK